MGLIFSIFTLCKIKNYMTQCLEFSRLPTQNLRLFMSQCLTDEDLILTGTASKSFTRCECVFLCVCAPCFLLLCLCAFMRAPYMHTSDTKMCRLVCSLCIKCLCDFQLWLTIFTCMCTSHKHRS